MDINALDEHKPLRDDIRLLGDLLSKVIQEQEGKELVTQLEAMRQLAKCYQTDDQNALVELIIYIQKIDNESLVPIIRSLSQFLNLSNIAEQYHRIRRARWHKRNQDPKPQPGSLLAVIPQLLKDGISADALHAAITKLNIELVLTAHPTEVKRRTIIDKYHQIGLAIEKLDREDLTREEQEIVKDHIQIHLTSVWQTKETRDKKPTAVDEARWGFAVIESSLWDALPQYLRKLDKVLKKYTQKGLPLDAVPIRFGSWMGGDRDGNPNVTASVTEQVSLMSRWAAADLYLKDIQKLKENLSMHQCNQAMREWVGDAAEPYRFLLKDVKVKLEATKKCLKQQLDKKMHAYDVSCYLTREALLQPLKLCYHSLVACNGQIIADGLLLDCIRRVECFGMSLMTLDIRQDAQVHSQLMSVITQALSLGSYQEWSESKKQHFILQELENNRALLPMTLECPPLLQDVLETFQLIGRLPKDGLGKYIISRTANPSDILLVALLQKKIGQHLLPIVPLFETIEDLTHAPDILNKLFGNTVYMQWMGRQQEVMIGYSDSAKDAGIIAASWAQYQAQEKMMAVAKKHQVELTFFHGRGGSTGRGGWPTHAAIHSLPPGTLNGKLRVTQQGEVIGNRFGFSDIARRALTVYITATLQATLNPSLEPKAIWCKQMQQLSKEAMREYQELVKNNKDFYAYFKQTTPISELGNLRIGSRPAKRHQNIDSIDSLRAIPWVFAWTQNRFLLSSWYGLPAAMKLVRNKKNGEIIKQMFHEWPFFQTMMTMCEMILAKADPRIAALYEDRLASKDLVKLGDQLRSLFKEGTIDLLQVMDQSKLLEQNKTLLRSIQLRTPYLLLLHLLQIEIIYRIRATTSDAKILQEALHINISGIAAGMRNTG